MPAPDMWEFDMEEYQVRWALRLLNWLFSNGPEEGGRRATKRIVIRG